MYRFIIAFIMLGSTLIFAGCGDADTPSGDGLGPELSPELQAMDALQDASRSRLRIEFGRERPRFIAMRVPVDPDAEPIERALAFLDEYKALYGLEDPWAQLFPQDVNRSEEGDVHVRLAQRGNGLPVYGAAISVHVAGDEVIATMGDYLPELAPGTPSGAA
ncbi:MAG: hypothetical protein JRG93_13515, partial [Deltaproteobacteria bacterium]|nr:hypothetical protein [Deltaproteobacteria bacterium]